MSVTPIHVYTDVLLAYLGSMSTRLLEHHIGIHVVLTHIHGLTDTWLSGLEDSVNGREIDREGGWVLGGGKVKREVGGARRGMYDTGSSGYGFSHMFTTRCTHARTHTHMQTYLSVLSGLEGGLPRFGCGSNVLHDANMNEEGGVFKRNAIAV